MNPTQKRQMISFVRRTGAWFDRVSDRIAPRETAGTSPTDVARGPILFGVWLMLGVFGIGGLWAAIAPLDSAAVANGQVVLDSNKKSIQHLEGGIVDEILVHEGMRVKKGQALVRLNATASKAQNDLYRGQYLSSLAVLARLKAERDMKNEVNFPEELTNLKNEDDVRDMIETQRRLFANRRESLEGQGKILGQKIEQSKREIDGLKAQISSANGQIGLLNEEITAVRTLLAQGNASKPRLLALERQSESLKGQRGENQAMISRAEQAMTESELSISAQKSDFMNKVETELKETQSKVSDLQERMRASSDIMDRIVIVSPIDGIVNGLAVHTVGGVIKPGETIMDIVPTKDKLIIEAQVSPQDIDVVHEGLIARVRLTAYKTRRVPQISGRVITVSADKFSEQRTGATYYLARIEVNQDELKKLKEVELTPGMPAQVLMVTGERTLLGYLTAPISDAMNSAFREQ